MTSELWRMSIWLVVLVGVFIGFPFGVVVGQANRRLSEWIVDQTLGRLYRKLGIKADGWR